ncbi:VanZ family protein [Candidatus Methylobacter oryzae]|nr:VanZ family protein [Candidatus Methylobacter oryzae]
MTIEHFYRLNFLAFSLILVLALFIGGSQPEAAGLFVSPVDKLVHFLYFGTFTFAIVMSRMLEPKYAAVLTVVLGAADELHQTVLPGRSPGIDDWLADSFGALIVVCIFSMIRKRQLA